MQGVFSTIFNARHKVLLCILSNPTRASRHEVLVLALPTVHVRPRYRQPQAHGITAYRRAEPTHALPTGSPKLTASFMVAGCTGSPYACLLQQPAPLLSLSCSWHNPLPTLHAHARACTSFCAASYGLLLAQSTRAACCVPFCTKFTTATRATLRQFYPTAPQPLPLQHTARVHTSTAQSPLSWLPQLPSACAMLTTAPAHGPSGLPRGCPLLHTGADTYAAAHGPSGLPRMLPSCSYALSGNGELTSFGPLSHATSY